MSLFALFTDSDQKAVITFETYVNTANKFTITPTHGYNCFAVYTSALYSKAKKSDFFYTGGRTIKYGKDFADQFNDAFKNISLEVINEQNIPVWEWTKEYGNRHIGPIYSHDLRKVMNNLRRQSDHFKRSTSKRSFPEHQISVQKLSHYNHYFLFRINAENFSEKGRAVVNKMVAITIRTLIPSFGYVMEGDLEDYKSDWIDYIIERSNKKIGGAYKAISEDSITRGQLLLLDDVALVNKAAEPMDFRYSISQTLFLRALTKGSKK